MATMMRFLTAAAVGNARCIDLSVNISQQIVSLCLAALNAQHEVVVQSHTHIAPFQQICMLSGH